MAVLCFRDYATLWCLLLQFGTGGAWCSKGWGGFFVWLVSFGFFIIIYFTGKHDYSCL